MTHHLTTGTMRVKAFGEETPRKHAIMIDDDGTIRVWDSVARHYTLRHGLAPDEEQRIRTVLNDTLIQGKAIRYDRSGIGHNWRSIDARTIPFDIREEIAAEIIDGKKESCDRYVATNGECYRW